MIHQVFKLLRILFVILSTLYFHFFISYFFPFPWNAVQVFLVTIVLLMIKHQSGTVVWYAFAILFCLDVFSAQVFGLQLVAGTMATMVLYWIYEYFFTNKSVVSALTVSAVGVLLYRSLYSFGLFILKITDHSAITSVSWGTLFSHMFIEMLGTAIATTAAFLILRPFFTELQSQKVVKRIFN